MRYAAVSALLCGLVVQPSAQSSAPQSADELRFEVASVKPLRSGDVQPFRPHPPDGAAFDAPLMVMISIAYGFERFRIIDLPSWVQTEQFTLNAKAGRQITDEERNAMLRTLLRERFGLRARVGYKQQTAYVLTLARPDRRLGPRLKSRPECVTNTCPRGGTNLPGELTFRAAHPADLPRLFMAVRGEPFVDETGLTGLFDMELSWRPEFGPGSSEPKDSRPSFFTAIEEQLGLKAIAAQRAVEVLIIESVERPAPD